MNHRIRSATARTSPAEARFRASHTGMGWLAALLLCMNLSAAPPAATTQTKPLPQLPANSRIAIIGDSITEALTYTRYVEMYLLACAGRADVTVCTFGHSGEVLANVISRQTDLQAFAPTIVAINEGMNDAGGNLPYAGAKGAAWQQTLNDALAMLAGRGVTGRIVAGPGLGDAKFDPSAAMQQRNDYLGHLRDMGHATATQVGCAFADMNHRMNDAVTLARQANPAYTFCANGGGIHPGPNGHLMMTHELLKALGCDGAIGTISVDLHGRATATAGHSVVSFANGAVTLDSARYPFCCDYDRSSGASESMASVLPFLPFEQELNRLVLQVTNLGAAGAQVTWGESTKTFTGAQLAAGINLPQEFLDTPFDAAFAHAMAALLDKQRFETFMSKFTANLFGNDNGGNIDANMLAVRTRKDAAVKAALLPVRHTIVIVPVGAPVTAAPLIAGTQLTYGIVGAAFTWMPTVVNGAGSFSAVGLPAGLAIDAASGVISATPRAVGTTHATITATNGGGSCTAALTIVIENPLPALPAITSPATAGAQTGAAFSYQIAAGNGPTDYFAWVIGAAGTIPPASSLPGGLSYDSRTGLLSGVPSTPGTYSISVAAMNAAGVAWPYPPNLTVTVAAGRGGGGGGATAPAIAAQPQALSVIAGQTATFAVTASGSPTPSYQWRRNGSAISGATAASYTTSATTAADSGAQFTVVVSNRAGSVTSAAATLTVARPP